ncbi:MAG: permease-like cell division protein FtsX [Lachnospiraceae bacterium]|nr:permease-like cell division protein FtsX [Lachnospiraceae bacterium]
MRRISSLLYGIGQGLKSIRRNKVFSLASIGTMAACLFLFGVFFCVLRNFEYVIKEAETNVGVTVFFDDGISEEKIEQIGDKIKLRAEVAGIEYTSADEAWENYKKNNLNEELIESFGDDNPLENSASYTVYLSDVSMQGSLVDYIKSLDGVRKVNDKAEIADSLSGFNKIIAYISGAIIIILLAVSAFLISTTVSTGISVRRKELLIMKLIGATNFFIRIPFIVEGIVIGLFGAAIPIIIVRFGYPKIIEVLEEKFSSVFSKVSFMPSSDIMSRLIPILLLIGIGVGFIGSQLTLRKQLKKIELH